MKKYKTPTLTVVRLATEQTIMYTSPSDGAGIGGEYDEVIPK